MSTQYIVVSSKNTNNSNMRHLSTSSLFPKVEDKKTKLFTSPNRFFILANRNDDYENPIRFQRPNRQQRRQIKQATITIYLYKQCG